MLELLKGRQLMERLGQDNGLVMANPRSFPYVELSFATRRGELVMVRPVKPTDVRSVAEFLGQLSADTRWLRYFSTRSLADGAGLEEATRMITGQGQDNIILAATVMERPNEIIAIAELVCAVDDYSVGEMALVVRDDYQANGIGRFLIWCLAETAFGLGITTLRADVLIENQVIRRIINQSGVPVVTSLARGENHIQAQLMDVRAAYLLYNERALQLSG